GSHPRRAVRGGGRPGLGEGLVSPAGGGRQSSRAGDSGGGRPQPTRGRAPRARGTGRPVGTPTAESGVERPIRPGRPPRIPIERGPARRALTPSAPSGMMPLRVGPPMKRRGSRPNRRQSVLVGTVQWLLVPTIAPSPTERDLEGRGIAIPHRRPHS